MARLFSSGFELNSTASGMEFDSTGGTISISSTTYRSGAYAMRGNPSSNFAYLQQDFQIDDGSGSRGVYYFRTYVRASSITSDANGLLRVASYAGDILFDVIIDSDRTVSLYDGYNWTQIGSSSSALDTDTWYRIELKVDDTTSTVTAAELKINGSTIASGTVDFSATHDYQGILVVGDYYASKTFDIFWDDVAINDDSGSDQNSYPGEGSIVHMHPDSAGDNAATTGIYSAIDEVTPNDATDYIEMDTNGMLADYNMETSANAGIGASDTITLVQVGCRCRGEAVQHQDGRIYIKGQSAGTIQYGTEIGNSSTSWGSHGSETSPKNYQLTSYINPQDSATWETGDLDSALIGFEAIDANPDWFITALWALVEYVPLSAITYSKANSSLANILKTETQDVSIKANVLIGQSETNNVKANINVTKSYANDVITNILSTLTKTNSSKANISATGQLASSIRANIISVNTKSCSTKAHIVRTETNINSVITNLLGSFQQNNSARANIGVGTFPLTDDFGDASLDVNKWQLGTNPTEASVEEGGVIKVQNSTVTTSGYIRSKYVYVPKYSTLEVKVSQHCTDGGFKLCPTDPAGHEWDVYSEDDWYNFQLTTSTTLSPSRKAGGGSIVQVGGDSPTLSTPYWMRMRIDDSIIYFDYRDNLTDQWTNISSEAWILDTPITTPLFVYFTAYNVQTTGVAHFDDFSWQEGVQTENNNAVRANIGEASATYTKDNKAISNIIRVGEASSNDIKANIITIGNTQSNDIKANIVQVSENEIDVRANIFATQTKNNSSKANVTVIGQHAGNVQANILRIGEVNVNSVKASVVRIESNSSQTLSNIKITPINDNQIKANVKSTITRDSSVKANMDISGAQPGVAKANILKTMISGQEVNWDVEYEANALPSNSIPAWTNVETGDPLESISSSILTIDCDTNDYLYYELDDASIDDEITVNARLKVITATGHEDIFLGISMGVGEPYVELIFYEDNLVLCDNSEIGSYAMDTTNGYHDYQVTISQGAIKVYVDGVLRISETSIDSNGDSLIWFGNFSGFNGRASESNWDYLRYRTDGAFPLGNDASRANIVKTRTYASSARASIVRTESYDQSARANIETTYTKNNSSKASIVVENQHASVSKTNILRADEQKDNSVRASIVVTRTDNSQVRANVVIYNTQVNSSKASILKTEAPSQSVKGNILETKQQSNSAKTSIVHTRIDISSVKANIIKIGNTQANSVKANIFVTQTYINSTLAFLTNIVTYDKQNSVKASIYIPKIYKGRTWETKEKRIYTYKTGMYTRLKTRDMR